MFETDIKAFENRVEQLSRGAVDEIQHGHYKAARQIIEDIIELEACKGELRFQQEMMAE